MCLILAISMAAPVMADVPPNQATATAPASVAPAAATTPAAQPAPESPGYIERPLPTCQQIKDFKNRLHQLINAALRYPAELSFYPATGVTIVGYDYQEGKVSNVRITQASNDGRLDRTAVNAVKNADYASVAAALGPLKIHDSVIIIFDNSGNSEKNTVQEQHKGTPLEQSCD